MIVRSRYWPTFRRSLSSCRQPLAWVTAAAWWVGGSLVQAQTPVSPTALPVTLPVLVAHTLQQHPAIQAQLNQVQGAVLGVDAAKWAYWPTPSLSLERASASNNDARFAGDATVSVFRLQQPLWTGGRLGANLNKAQARALFAEATLEDTRQGLVTRVVQAWGDWVVATHKVEAVQASRTTHARLLGMVERRANEGVSAMADVSLARSRIGVLDAKVLLLQAQRQSALDKLSSLAGYPVPSQTLQTDAVIPPLASQVLLELVAMAQERSPGVLAARHQADAAFADIGVAKSALLPEVFVRYEHQHGSFSTAGAPSTQRVFVGLNSALGGGLSSLSGVGSAAAQHAAAQQDIDVQRQAVEDQVRADWTLWQAAQTRLASLQQANQASASVLASYERQFLAGRKQWLDLMNAAREQAQSASQVADAMGALQISGFRLILLTQGTQALAHTDLASTPLQGRQP